MKEWGQMLHVARKTFGITLLAFGLALAGAATASAQVREFTGKVDSISEKKIIIDNRQGDKVSFSKLDDTTVEGLKTSWADVKKGDWATVEWKFVDKPRKAYKVTIIPPKEEVGEEEP
jgi:hypothetical protein